MVIILTPYVSQLWQVSVGMVVHSSRCVYSETFFKKKQVIAIVSNMYDSCTT